MNAAVSQQVENDLIYVHDSKTREVMLVDGGASLSIDPPTSEQRANGPVTDIKLQAANGTPINCYGRVRKEISLGDRTYPFDIIVADVSQPLLGADFLAANYLAPNHRDKCLIDLHDLSVINAEIASFASHSNINFVTDANNPFNKLLDERFHSITVPSFKLVEPKHGICHRIPTTGRPVQSKVRRLAPDKLALAEREFKKLADLGVCKRAKSEWASPLLVANKPDGGYRICGDYRRLNAMTEDDKYPVKTLSDFNVNLSGMKIFSKIDLLKGYHQIPVHPDDIGKTAVVTPFGLFIFPRTPFGLKNAGQDFQRMMDSILGDIPYCFVYIDDLLVFSKSPEEHLEHLANVFSLLEQNGLVVNRTKCVLGVESLEFLGYKVDANGVSPLEDRVQAIRDCKPPTTIKELQRFLGMLKYYREFVPKAADHLFELFEALKGSPRTLKWTPECGASFEAIKEALAAAVMLHHPRPGAKLAITSDASKLAIGAVLEQQGPKGWEPLGFFSAKLLANQQEWPPFDRELLAAFRSIRHFRHWVEGRVFTLYTDHQSLIPALHKKTEPQTARQTYQLAGIAEFTTDIRYLEGKANAVADALSRPNEIVDDPIKPQLIASVNSLRAWTKRMVKSTTLPGSASETLANTRQFPSSSNALSATSRSSARTSTPPPTTPMSKVERPLPPQRLDDLSAVIASVGPLGVDLPAMATEQALDPEFARISNDANSGLSFRRINLGDTTILADISNGPARPFVPFAWRKRVFNAIHGLGHPGVERTRQSVAAKFVWPSLRADVSRWARECLNCQRAKVTRHTVPEIGNFEVPTKRFSHIHADITMVPTSNGFSYLLTIVDRFTRWPTAIPIKDISTETIVDAFAHGWLSSFGVPKAITTDRGSQFTSAVWTQLMRVWGIEHHMTTAYHPEANGLVERFHRRLKESLIALCQDERDQWFWRLPCVLLSIRNTLKPDIGASPADLVYGEGLAVPGELLGSHPDEDHEVTRQQRIALSNLRMEVERLQPTATSAHRTPIVHIPDNLAEATHVMVKRGGVQPPLMSPSSGPFRIEARTPTGYRIFIPGRGVELVALSRLKACPIFVDEGQFEPQDLSDEAPPTPPPPGRRPGPRTRPPEPTDRVTRQSTQNQPAPPMHRQSRRGVRNIDEFAAPPSLPVIREEEPVATSAAPLAPPPPNRSNSPSTFSSPRPGDFSYRRRPDLSVIYEHLGIPSTSATPEDSSPPQETSNSLGGM